MRFSDFFRKTPRPEEKLTELLMAFCDPYDGPTESLEQARAECLLRLRAVAATDRSVQTWVDTLSNAKDPLHAWTERELLDIHQVAVGNAIIEDALRLMPKPLAS